MKAIGKLVTLVTILAATAVYAERLKAPTNLRFPSYHVYGYTIPNAVMPIMKSAAAIIDGSGYRTEKGIFVRGNYDYKMHPSAMHKALEQADTTPDHRITREEATSLLDRLVK